ncbi:MAG: peptidase P60 [Robiginitomaculum sp.]|nr:MAG: peptidase P60 [Robiginitomaculum sp.]
MTETEFDPRLTPARDDLAAEKLRTSVQAACYVEAQPMQVCVPLARLYGAPDARTMLQTELLLGEGFEVYEQKNGWVWGQASRDGYVGYVEALALSDAVTGPDHQICVPRTPIFARPDLKAPIGDYAHGNTVFACTAQEDLYVQLGPDKGWVFARHAVPLGEKSPDWVRVAEAYEHTPYVWGGRSSFGLDCSALVQNALQAGGVAALRDTDMQVKTLGTPIPVHEDLSGLHRGDLIFWKGHVGIMLDAHIVLHANAWHMAVAREPLAEAVARIKKTAGGITAIRRL